MPLIPHALRFIVAVGTVCKAPGLKSTHHPGVLQPMKIGMNTATGCGGRDPRPSPLDDTGTYFLRGQFPVQRIRVGAVEKGAHVNKLPAHALVDHIRKKPKLG